MCLSRLNDRLTDDNRAGGKQEMIWHVILLSERVRNIVI